MKKILLAEDDLDLGAMLKLYLEINNYKVIWAKDGEEAFEIFNKTEVSICVFDVMMPKMDGFTLAEKIIKIEPETAIIFLTALSDKNDRLKGLKIGVDDYVTKPFEIDELLLRIKNTIRRTEQNIVDDQSELEERITKIGKYTFDPKNLELKLNKRSNRLTEKEALLIQYLNNHKGKLMKREALLKAVWGKEDFFSGRSMDVFISRLRKYFADDKKIRIRSIRGIGFEFSIG